MAKSSKVPPHALRLTSYVELEAYVQAFAAGHLHLLLLFGPPGVGKSRAVRQALDPQVGWISGQATPLGIYLQAFAYRHQPLVLVRRLGQCIGEGQPTAIQRPALTRSKGRWPLVCAGI
jgi:hypothetical protein